MKRFMLGIALMVGAASQINAMNQSDALMKGTEALAAVTKKIGDVLPKVPTVFNQTKEAVLDIKNMVQRLKDMPELMKAGMPVDQFVRVMGGNLADLESGLISRLQEVVTISLVDFVGVFTDKSVQLGGQWNDLLNDARRAVTTLSDVLASVRLPQGTQASMQYFLRMPVVENTQDLASATAKQPSALARLKLIPAAAKKLPVVLSTVQNTLSGTRMVISNIQALSRNLPTLSDIQKVNEVGRLLAQLQAALVNNAGIVVGIAITDFGGIFSDKIALAGRKLSAVMGNFNDMVNAMALMLQSVHAPGTPAPQLRPVQQASPYYQSSQTPPSTTANTPNSVPSPWQMVRPQSTTPATTTPQYDPSRGYEQFAVPQQR